MISVVVPVYNTDLFLDKCIESIVNQSFTDWECILIDDGSTDRSGTICDEWEERESRIKVIHQSNSGVSVARNHGLSVAKGEFIAFVDSDDWLDLDYFESLYSLLIKTGADLVISGMILEYTSGAHEMYIPTSEEVFNLSSDNTDKFIALNDKFLLYPPYLKLFSRRIITDNSILFDKNYSYGEDLLFNFQYLSYVHRIATLSNAKYHYRVFSNNSLSKRVRLDKFEVDYKQWQVLKSFYESKEMWNEASKHLLYKRLWGSIYDGIFIFPLLPNRSLSYLKKILSIPEIHELRFYKDLFNCSYWIKQAILLRSAFIFYCYFSFNIGYEGPSFSAWW